MHYKLADFHIPTARLVGACTNKDQSRRTSKQVATPRAGVVIEPFRAGSTRAPPRFGCLLLAVLRVPAHGPAAAAVLRWLARAAGGGVCVALRTIAGTYPEEYNSSRGESWPRRHEVGRTARAPALPRP